MLAADPGLGQLQAGWRTFVAMVTALAVGYGMARALDIPAMIGMMVGGMMGLMSAFAVAENTWQRLTHAILWMPFPYAAVLWLAAELHDDRRLEIGLMVGALALTFFLARFGQLSLLTGMMLFNGLMVGMMANIPAGMSGKAFLVALTSAAAVLATRLLLCYPMPREDLLRTQRAFVVEARRVADAAVEALDPDADQERAVRRMARALRRLNVTTVTIDGRLAQPEVAADPDMAELLHRHLFDAELALRGIGRAVQDLTRLDVPPDLREALVVGLVVARDTPLGGAQGLRPAAEIIRQQADAVPHLPHAAPSPPDAVQQQTDTGTGQAESVEPACRVAHLLDSLAGSLSHWLALGRNSPESPDEVPFQSTVALERNRPAGSAAATKRVLAAGTETSWRRAVPFVRAPLHAGVAAAIVCPITDAIDPHRFYWGLVGVMITLFGTNTTHERLRKFGHRMAGTVVGAVIGIALLHLVGHGHVYVMLTVIVAGITLGAWGMQRAYAFWVVGLVVALVQLYGLTTPDAGMDHLLGERLLDNGLGILVATVCAALIFPLSGRRITREAERGYVSAVDELVSQLALRWEDPDAPVRLRGAARAVDSALFQVVSLVRPLVRMPLGVRERDADNRTALLTTATGHARALAAAADIDIDLAPRQAERFTRITATLTGSLRALDRALATGEPDEPWQAVTPLIRELKADLDPAPPGPRAGRIRTALRELAALDESLAGYAERCGLTVRSTPRQDVVSSPMERRTQALVAEWGIRRTPHDAATSGRSAGVSTTAAPGTATAAPQSVPPTPPAVSATPSGGVTVAGTVRCDRHPAGCAGWITVIDARGKRVAAGSVQSGRYRVAGLRPGPHTLVVSASAHAPHAELLSVPNAGGTGRIGHDMRL
ncbi:FUSC family protein [Streptomyces sp. NBC_01257]|uniref:FUSC family protein n=1 Tax=Streptomyces sp. NBC_01257 TaxID=2903799 RepID=UPI002DDB92DC|nr:FUSC family protein [Streptomyces sp. NBC_01257]WRZ69543.1 FUSC family protein [Streptomyces sp. NBC_01257]